MGPTRRRRHQLGHKASSQTCLVNGLRAPMCLTLSLVPSCRRPTLPVGRRLPGRPRDPCDDRCRGLSPALRADLTVDIADKMLIYGTETGPMSSMFFTRRIFTCSANSDSTCEMYNLRKPNAFARDQFKLLKIDDMMPDERVTCKSNWEKFGERRNVCTILSSPVFSL